MSIDKDYKYKDPKQGETTYTCKNCDGAATFDSAKKLRGHQIKCRPEKIQEKEEVREERTERVSFGTPEQKWNTPDNDGYHYRVFNDNWKKEPGRVQRAIKAGYEVVIDPNSGTNVGTNDDGSEIKAVLMRIPDKFYKEDQGKKDKKLDEIDAQIKGQRFSDKMGPTYGSVNIETESK